METLTISDLIAMGGADPQKINGVITWSPSFEPDARITDAAGRIMQKVSRSRGHGIIPACAPSGAWGWLTAIGPNQDKGIFPARYWEPVDGGWRYVSCTGYTEAFVSLSGRLTGLTRAQWWRKLPDSEVFRPSEPPPAPANERIGSMGWPAWKKARDEAQAEHAEYRRALARWEAQDLASWVPWTP